MIIELLILAYSDDDFNVDENTYIQKIVDTLEINSFDFTEMKWWVEKKAALDKELREVSIRVNLFEKVLIPRSEANIKKIKVFLGDMELAAVSQAKVAKTKIEAGKEKRKKRLETAYAG